VIGDKLVVTDYHRNAAKQIREFLADRLGKQPLAVSVAGESGCGKSETAQCLADLAAEQGLTWFILGQDDYFKLPPKTNHRRRQEDLTWVGPSEVELDLMDHHVAALKTGQTKQVEKPLVYFEEDRIGSEQIPGGPYDLVITEGTYTTLLQNVDVRAFIDRNYRQTKKARLTRGRDPDVLFLEQVLAIEHDIISKHKALADVVIAAPADEQAPSA